MTSCSPDSSPEPHKPDDSDSTLQGPDLNLPRHEDTQLEKRYLALSEKVRAVIAKDAKEVHSWGKETVASRGLVSLRDDMTRVVAQLAAESGVPKLNVEFDHLFLLPGVDGAVLAGRLVDNDNRYYLPVLTADGVHYEFESFSNPVMACYRIDSRNRKPNEIEHKAKPTLRRVVESWFCRDGLSFTREAFEEATRHLASGTGCLFNGSIRQFLTLLKRRNPELYQAMDLKSLSGSSLETTKVELAGMRQGNMPFYSFSMISRGLGLQVDFKISQSPEDAGIYCRGAILRAISKAV